MEKKNLDWANLGFGYMVADYRYVANYKDGKWDDGELTTDDKVVLSECAGVFQYAQTIFEGLKAYTTEDGHIVCFRPDLNAARLNDSAKRLEMPTFPEDRFIKAVEEVVKANAAWVPPFGSGATLYIRPYMMGTNPVIGVKPAEEYQFRIFVTPVGPYFKGGAKPLTIRVSDFDRAAPNKYYRVSYTLYPNNADEILSNVEDEYELEYNNIGGEETTIIKKSDARLIEGAKKLIDGIIERYIKRFRTIINFCWITKFIIYVISRKNGYK